MGDMSENAQISDKLISYIRGQLDDPDIAYDTPCSRMEGGFETAIYELQLNRIGGEPHKRLVLRLFPDSRPPENAVKEYVVQNVLANEGFPVARTYLLCTDKSVLGGAFFLMDFLPGKSLMSAPIETVPEILGRTHVSAHSINPEPLVHVLEGQGLWDTVNEINYRTLQLQRLADQLPWAAGVAEWLMKNQPPEPGSRAICHGDFHPHNILMDDGRVSGVIDWPDFCIGDAALDVANTHWILSLLYKRQAAKLDPGLASIDWDLFAQRYLEAYRTKLPVADSKLDYFRVLRCMKAIGAGFRGQELFRDPLIVKEIVRCIREITGMLLTPPA